MNTTRFVGAALPLAATPLSALADSGAFAENLETGVVAVLGIAGAVAWHHFATKRHDWAERWHHLHLADRWHHLHVAEALATKLHLRSRRRR